MNLSPDQLPPPQHRPDQQKSRLNPWPLFLITDPEAEEGPLAVVEDTEAEEALEDMEIVGTLEEAEVPHTDSIIEEPRAGLIATNPENPDRMNVASATRRITT
jgi:hypothetical protein